MFKAIKNIGCLVIIGLAMWFFYGIYAEMEKRESEPRKQETPPDPNAPPPNFAIEMMFKKTIREHLREKHGPKANIDNLATPRVGNHRDGWFYICEYIGHDELGRSENGIVGLLYKTNAITHWTYYPQDAIKDILPEVTVDGKPLSDLLKR